MNRKVKSKRGAAGGRMCFRETLDEEEHEI